LAFDIVWLFLYSGKWTSVDTYDVMAQGSTHGFVIFLSFINLIIKTIFAMLIYMVDLQYNRQRISVPRIVTKEATPVRTGSVGIRY